jgi:hypothetical protein
MSSAHELRDADLYSSDYTHVHNETCKRSKEATFRPINEESSTSTNTSTSTSGRSALQQHMHSKLCRYCQHIFDHWPAPEICDRSKFSFPHYSDELELKTSAENDCSLCAQFVLGFDRISDWYNQVPYLNWQKEIPKSGVAFLFEWTRNGENNCPQYSCRLRLLLPYVKDPLEISSSWEILESDRRKTLEAFSHS